MKKLNSKGFGIVEGLLIVVILGLIGGVGYYVYSANKDSNSQQSSESQVANTTAEKDDGLPDVTTTLEIKEWGVKLDVKGATDPIYKMQDGVAWISTSTFENSEECKKNNEQLKGASPEIPYFQGIAKLKANDKPWGAYPDETETVGELYEQKNDMVIKIGEDYFSYAKGNGMACSDAPRPDFFEAFKTLSEV